MSADTLARAGAGSQQASASPIYAPRSDVTEFGLRRLLIVVGVMAAALLQTLDSTITNVALPTIQGNLGASQDEGTWVITAYTIASIIIIPLTPWLQNRFGRKNYYVASIVGFTVASAACGAAQDLGFLIVARAVQGAFGGGLLATSQSILRDTFPPEQLGLSQGVFALGAIMGPALGPPLGGILVDNWSWNWCFDINIVPGTFSAIILLLLLRDPDAPRSNPVDVVGLALLAAGLGSLQYVLTEGEQHYWFADHTIALMTIVCVASLVTFVLYELYGARFPIVDLRVLANPSVWAGTVLALALGASILGSTYTIPQFTQGPLGFTPTLSGFLFILRAGPIALCTFPIVRLSGRIDTRILLVVGFILLGSANVWQAYITTPQSTFWSFAPALILSGVGAALLWVPLSIAVLSATTPSDGPKASAFVNLAVQLGGSIAVASLDVLIHNREQFHSAILAANLTLGNTNVRDYLQAHSPAQLAQLAYAQATILSYADAAFAVALISIAFTPLIFLMRKRKGAAPVTVEVAH